MRGGRKHSAHHKIIRVCTRRLGFLGIVDGNTHPGALAEERPDHRGRQRALAQVHAVQSGDQRYVDTVVGEQERPGRARRGLEIRREAVEPRTGRRVTTQVEGQTAPTRSEHPARAEGEVGTREKGIVGDDVERGEQAITRSDHPRPRSVP